MAAGFFADGRRTGGRRGGKVLRRVGGGLPAPRQRPGGRESLFVRRLNTAPTPTRKPHKPRRAAGVTAKGQGEKSRPARPMGVGGQARGRRRVSLRVALYTYTHRNIELQVYIICSGRAGNLSFSMPPVDLLALSLFRTGTEAAEVLRWQNSSFTR